MNYSEWNQHSVVCSVSLRFLKIIFCLPLFGWPGDAVIEGAQPDLNLELFRSKKGLVKDG
jgi:hypothetical protein